MLSYYSAVIIICCMALGVLCICVGENARLTREEKSHHYLAYLLIICAASAEWLGVQWNGNAAVPAYALAIAKCADYILTPFAGGMLVRLIRIRNIWSRLLLGILVGNAIFQVISAFTGWMVNIDENHCYSHGRLYYVYMAVYLLVAVIIVIEFFIYGNLYRKQNRFSLYAILVLTISGIALQEFIGNSIRTAYLSLTFASILLYIHITEYAQLAADDHIEEQERQLVTDPLTGILNRYAYDRRLEELNCEEQLPEDLVVFSIDLNGLKAVNDSLGHAAGDELICGAASCLTAVFSAFGQCYRVGGDEFFVIAMMDREQASLCLAAVEEQCLQWSGEKAKHLRMAIGAAFAADDTHLSPEQLARAADMAMYGAKSAYYRDSANKSR